jgi:hypothetical protein
MEGSPSARRLPDRLTRVQITAATRRESTSLPMQGRFHASGAPGSLIHRTRAVDQDRTLDQSEMLSKHCNISRSAYEPVERRCATVQYGTDSHLPEEICCALST